MNKIRPIVPASALVSLGAIVAAACGSFSSGSDGAGAGGSTMGTSGASSTSGAGSTVAGSGTVAGSSSVAGSGTGGSGTAGSGTGGTGTAGSGTGGTAGSGTAGTGTAGSGTAGGGGGGAVGTVCDLLATAGNPCVAAHSTTRVLYTGYAGPLYQLCKGSFTAGPASCTSGMTMDIGSVGGFADSAAHDAFCPTGASCTFSIIYDQSPKKNDLTPGPAGGAKGTPDNPANAGALKTKLAGHTVYGVLIKPGMGYRKLVAAGTAVGDEPETQYMVSGQQDLVNGCCFDYGNAETDAHDDGNGTMEAVYLGLGVVWGTGVQGGPWVMADLENGLYAGWENKQDRNISTNTPLKYDFINAVVVGDTKDKNGGKGRFALYGGDATTGVLKTMYDGIRPEKQGYVPMLKQGSIILGIGGDNSDGDGGRWYEGVMTTGAATLATVNALQANVVAAGYGK